MDSKTKGGVIGGGVLLVVIIAILAVLLVGTKGDLSDSKDDLASAQDQHSQDGKVHATDLKTIKDQKATILKLNPPAWSKAVAAKMYLSYVKPGNEAIDKYNKLNNPTLSQAKQFCERSSLLDNRAAQDFQGGHWPKFVKSAIADLVDNYAEQVASDRDCARSESFDEYNAVDFPSGKPAQKVRILLGLPSAR